MRIEYTSATGCPYGQFVVYAETPEEGAILDTFLQIAEKTELRKKWDFWLHGYGWTSGNPHIEHFNFGWTKKKNGESKIKRFLKKVRVK